MSTLPLVRFQSTPLPTGRSDCKTPMLDLIEHGFNPRPSQPEGATAGTGKSWLYLWFQSTPLPTGRSDDAP